MWQDGAGVRLPGTRKTSPLNHVNKVNRARSFGKDPAVDPKSMHTMHTRPPQRDEAKRTAELLASLHTTCIPQQTPCSSNGYSCGCCCCCFPRRLAPLQRLLLQQATGTARRSDDSSPPLSSSSLSMPLLHVSTSMFLLEDNVLFLLKMTKQKNKKSQLRYSMWPKPHC